MDLLVDSKPKFLQHRDCGCHACSFRPKLQIVDQESDVNRSNNFNDFIKMLPIGFPLLVEHTLALERNSENTEYISFFNPKKDDRCKWILSRQSVKNVNTLSSQNLQLYFPKYEKILQKYEVQNMLSAFTQSQSQRTEAQQVIYIQPYQPYHPTRIVRIHYHHKRPLQDNLQLQFLAKEEGHFQDQNYKVKEEMLEWIFKEDSPQSLCHFLTEYYIRLFKAWTRHEIRSGVFIWVLHPYEQSKVSKELTVKPQDKRQREMGLSRKLPFKPKLLNVKSMQVDFFEKLYSFQDEYSDKIRERIQNSQKSTISAIKNKGYRLRLENFRKKLKNVYENEQEAVLGKIEEEKPFSFQHDSESMAKMLIPNLAPYKSLREVINDEEAFRKVFAKDIKGPPKLKTEYKIKSLTVKKKEMSGTKIKPRSKTTMKDQENVSFLTAERRHKWLLKTPSTHQ